MTNIFELYQENDLRAVPIEYVCAKYGVLLDDLGRAKCPFHEPDAHPSFQIWEGDDGVQRFSCFPCGIKGDVIDLVGRLEHCGYVGATEKIRDLKKGMPDEWSPALVLASSDRQISDSFAYIKECQERAALDPMLVPSLLGIPDRALPGFGLGLDHDGSILFPYWTAPPEREIVACMIRHPNGQRESVGGSRFRCMYLDWWPDERDTVIICEGETDSLWACVNIGQHVDVRGVQGAATRPEAVVGEFPWKRALLAFDGDTAGKAATIRWRAFLSSIDVDVLDVGIPDGEDLRSWGKPDVLLGL